jgi:hypothetical protein
MDCPDSVANCADVPATGFAILRKEDNIMKLFAILAVVAASLALSACSTCQKPKTACYAPVQQPYVQAPATNRTVEK